MATGFIRSENAHPQNYFSYLCNTSAEGVKIITIINYSIKTKENYGRSGDGKFVTYQNHRKAISKSYWLRDLDDHLYIRKTWFDVIILTKRCW